MSELTLGDIPNLDVAITAARYKLVRSTVIIQTEYIAGVTFQDFGGQSLFQFIKQAIESAW